MFESVPVSMPVRLVWPDVGDAPDETFLAAERLSWPNLTDLVIEH